MATWKPAGPKGRLGFYGCGRNGNTRIVVVGEALQRSDPRPSSSSVCCPACGEEHPIKVMWRNRKRDEQDRPVELAI